MLQWHKHTDATCRGVDRAGEGDDEQQRVVVHHGKRHASGDHETGGRQQKQSIAVSGTKKSGAYGEKG